MDARYLVRRFAQLVLVVWLAVTLNFLIPRLLPGDPITGALTRASVTAGGNIGNIQQMAQVYNQKFGLTRPLWEQYLAYLGDLSRGDLGTSITDYPQTAASKISAALPWSLGLLTVSTLVAFTLGTILGALARWPKTPRPIRWLTSGFILLSTIPYFLLAIVLVYAFAVVFRLLPGAGGFDSILILRPNVATAVDLIRHAILPCASIVLGTVGFWVLGMRGVVASVIGEDYVTFAEAKGLSPGRIFVWYGVRNALLAQLTNLGLALAAAASGAVLVEVVFAYPGLGYLLYKEILAQDYPVVQGIVLFLTIAIAVILMVLDLIYPLLDPRIRYGRQAA